MSKGFKTVLIIAAVVGLGYLTFAKGFASKLLYTFKGVKKPRIDLTNKAIEMPVTFNIDNKNNTPFTIDKCTGNVFYADSSNSVKVSNIERFDVVQVPAKTMVEYTVFIKVPLLDLGLSALQLIKDNSWFRKFKVNGTITATIGGQTFNVPFNETLQLAQ